MRISIEEKSAEEDFQLDRKNRWVYDKHGNEVSAESSRGKQLVSKKIREITYH